MFVENIFWRDATGTLTQLAEYNNLPARTSPTSKYIIPNLNELNSMNRKKLDCLNFEFKGEEQVFNKFFLQWANPPEWGSTTTNVF